MRWGSLSIGCMVLACGPRVGLEDGDARDTDFDGTGQTTPMPTTVEPMTTVADSGGPVDPPPPLCFATENVYQTEESVDQLSLADTRGDGLPEIWLSSLRVDTVHPYSWILGLRRAPDGYEAYVSTTLDGGLTTWSDMDGSGRDDALYLSFSGEQPEWRASLSDAAGVPSTSVVFASSGLEWLIGWFDVTHDNRADAFTSEGGLLQIWRGDGTGAFSPTTNSPLAPWLDALSVQPSRFDERAFAVVLRGDCADACPHAVGLMAMAPGGALVRYATSEALDGPSILSMRPIDEDERPDVVVRSHDIFRETGILHVLLAQEDGGLTSARELSGVDVAVAGDFDGDGSVELMWRSAQQTQVGAALPEMGGDFAVDVELEVAGNRRRVADLDGDGREEIVQLRAVGNTFVVEVIRVVDCP